MKNEKLKRKKKDTPPSSLKGLQSRTSTCHVGINIGEESSFWSRDQLIDL